MSDSFDNTSSHMNKIFDCTLNIRELCVKHLVKSITNLTLQKGISVCFTDWDTNSNKEQNNMDCVKIIKLIKNTLLQIKENALMDFEYTDKGLDIKLKKDTIDFTIHFKTQSLETKFIFDKIEEFRLECEDKFNVDVNNIFTQSELPLYVIIIDTNNPHDGQLHEIKEDQTILKSIMAFILERFDEN